MGKTMSYGLNRFNTRTKLMAGALALILAGASHAATQVGGGATLPSIGYVGTNAATMLQVTGSNIDSGSLFGVYASQSGNGVSYCLTGSGAGKNILAGVSGFGVQMDCVKDTSGTVHGFGAAAVSRTDLTQPNFAGADSPLALTDYNNYIANHPSGYFPTQFPAVAGAVAIAFNLKDSQGAKVTSSEVNFSDTQLCQIFSGTITDWSDSRLSSAFTLPSGDSIPAGAINVQYRSDGSGTTFSISNHLANVCGSAGLSNVFETSQNFAGTGGVVSNFFTTGGVETLPSNWTGSSGNPGVANAIAGTSDSIGYVETANALATNPGLQFADVNSKSPQTNFGTALAVPASAVVFNEVISSTNNANGTAALSAISNAPATKCIALIPPADYAVPGSRGGIVPSTSYPIVAISYLMGNTDGNGTDLAATQGLLASPYDSTVQSSVTTIGGTTGLAFLSPASGAFTGSQVSGCLVN